MGGAYILGNGVALVLVGYIGFADVWEPAPNGTSVYGQAFYLVFFNLHTTNTTVSLGARQANGFTTNASVFIPALGSSAVTLTLSNDASWVTTTLYFDGQGLWVGQVATPVSLLPSYILDIGGIDLLALTLISFMLFVVMLGVVLAHRVMRKAGYAPKFSMLVYGHVLLFLIVAAVFVDYQQIDSIFAGWSPLVYPWLLLPMSFLWGLSLFNRAEDVQVQEGTLTASGEMGYYVTNVKVMRIASGPNRGKLGYVDESWAGVWARFWGHMPVADDGDERHPRPWLAPVLPRPSPTGTRAQQRRARRGAATAPLSGAEALTRFPVLTPRPSGPSFIAQGRAGEPPRIDFPKLVFHRTVTVTTTKVVDGVPVTTTEPRRRLSLPHYVDPPRSPAYPLEDTHYMPAAAVWAGFGRLRDLGRALSKYAHAATLIDSGIERRVQDELYSHLRGFYAMRRRVSSGISEEEAAELTGHLSAYLKSDEPKEDGT